MFLAAACAPSRTTLRETESGAPFRAACFVARLAKGGGHWLRLASRIPSRKAAVATAWDLIRGSLGHLGTPGERQQKYGGCNQQRKQEQRNRRALGEVAALDTGEIGEAGNHL